MAAEQAPNADLARPDHRGLRAVQHLVEYAPATGGLALWLHHRDGAADDGALVRTDGQTLFYGPGFAALPLPRQAGAVAHAVLHAALRHPQRLQALQAVHGDVDARLFNTCADAIVNSTLGHLAWLALPPDAVTLTELLAATGLGGDATGRPADPESLLLAWDVEALYRAIDDRQTPDDSRPTQRRNDASAAQADEAGSRPAPVPPRRDGPRAARVRALGAATPPDLLPDAQRDGQAPEAQAEQARDWRERLLRAHAGDGAFSMLRTLGADLPHSRVPWPLLLRSALARALAARTALSWSRPARSYLANQGRAGPHRRLPFEPGTVPQRAVPRLVVVVDVSGSLDDRLLNRFASEVEAIRRRTGAGLVLVLGDDRVRAVQVVDGERSPLRDWPQQGLAGGGGTDFGPLLQAAHAQRPDLVLVLTDLDGPAGFRPAAPVLWAVPAVPGLATPVAPFGRVLVLD
jgi:predicted metal-dependent peptidase